MENNLIIRTMTKDDIDDVYRVEEDCFVDPWSKDAIRKELTNNLARYIVAEMNNSVVGYIGCWFVLDEGHITNVAVHSDYRGNKIGDKLVNAMVDLCKECNMNAMTLEVRSSNSVAQGLYRKYGFKMGGIRKEYYSDNKEDAIIMWNQLKEV